MKKILFIHGYSQNAHIFRSKTAVIRKQLALFECIYINAPHKVPAPNDPQVDERAWWNAEQTESGMKYTGISTSLDMLNNEWKTGEYVGIIGFSQGAWHDGLTQHGQHLCPATSSPAIVHDCALVRSYLIDLSTLARRFRVVRMTQPNLRYPHNWQPPHSCKTTSTSTQPCAKRKMSIPVK